MAHIKSPLNQIKMELSGNPIFKEDSPENLSQSIDPLLSPKSHPCIHDS